MTSKPTLVDHVRETIRALYAYPGRAEQFRLREEVYVIADRDANQYPGHLNQKVRHAVMRQMIQDERAPMGLTFVEPGVYRYPQQQVKGEDMRRFWIDADVQYMREHKSEGASALAAHFGRSEGATRQKARSKGISLESRPVTLATRAAAEGEQPQEQPKQPQEQPQPQGQPQPANAIRTLQREHAKLAKEFERLSEWAMRRGYKYSKRRQAFLAEGEAVE